MTSNNSAYQYILRGSPILRGLLNELLLHSGSLYIKGGFPGGSLNILREKEEKSDWKFAL